MKITLSTTTRPVSYDYAAALDRSGHLFQLVSAFPKRSSREIRGQVSAPVVFVDQLQIAFLLANRFAAGSKLALALSHLSKLRLDSVTRNRVSGSDACVFYSGAGLKTIERCRRDRVLSVAQVHHAHVEAFNRILSEEALRCEVPFTPIYSQAQVRRQLAEFAAVDRILCPSNAVRESFVTAGIAAEKLVVVPHGVQLDTQPQEEAAIRETSDSAPFQVLYVGQLHFRKGLRYLAEAVTGLQDIQCRFVGPDFGLSGLNRVQLDSCIERVGALKGPDLIEAYRQADVFVLPSVEEGFGLVVLEAMQAGCPVILSSAVGAKDFVTDGVEGWIVPPRDSNAIRERIDWMRAHPEERKQMGAAAARKAATLGGWDAAARQLIDALDNARQEIFHD